MMAGLIVKALARTAMPTVVNLSFGNGLHSMSATAAAFPRRFERAIGAAPRCIGGFWR